MAYEIPGCEVSKHSTEDVSCLGCVIILMIYAAIMGLMTFWTDRNLDFWISHFKGEDVDVPTWLSLVASVVGGPIMLTLNLIGEIGRYFL